MAFQAFDPTGKLPDFAQIYLAGNQQRLAWTKEQARQRESQQQLELERGKLATDTAFKTRELNLQERKFQTDSALQIAADARAEKVTGMNLQAAGEALSEQQAKNREEQVKRANRMRSDQLILGQDNTFVGSVSSLLAPTKVPKVSDLGPGAPRATEGAAPSSGPAKTSLPIEPPDAATMLLNPLKLLSVSALGVES